MNAVLITKVANYFQFPILGFAGFNIIALSNQE